MLKLLIRAKYFIHMLLALVIFAKGLAIRDGFLHWLFVIYGPVAFGLCLYNLSRKVPEYREIPNERAIGRAFLVAWAILMIPPIVMALVVYFVIKYRGHV
jgi:hypothetical protein